MNLQKLPVGALVAHPLNDRIYRDQADDELVTHIGRLGIVQPLLVTQEGVVISGHRRLDAARRLALDEVPVLVVEPRDPLDVEEMIIEANRHRRQSNEQLVREYQHLKSIEARRLGTREEPVSEPAPMAAHDPAPPVAAPPALADKEHREVQARAARRVGRAPGTLEKGVSVVAHIDALQKDERVEEASELRKVLNTRSVGAAFRQIAPEPEKPPAPRPPVTRMKRIVTDLQEWISDNDGSPHLGALLRACDALNEAIAAVESSETPTP
jgi:ParB family chromosome partitioning protein